MNNEIIYNEIGKLIKKERRKKEEQFHIYEKGLSKY